MLMHGQSGQHDAGKQCFGDRDMHTCVCIRVYMSRMRVRIANREEKRCASCVESTPAGTLQCSSSDASRGVPKLCAICLAGAMDS